ncbi:MAG: hypothetical protein U9R27_03375 [Campylobacterota bacterium]|nr:hypothetical protein [Campylobacterota bacterium]
MRFVLSLILYIGYIAEAGINPLVLFNQDNIKHHQALIPLPSDQIFKAKKLNKNRYQLSIDDEAWVTIEASQTLYIYMEDKKKCNLTLLASLDGRLYHHQKVSQEKGKNGKYFYRIKNNFNQILALKLSSFTPTLISLATTYPVSPIQKISPPSISLPLGEDSHVIYRSSQTSRRYDRFRIPTKSSIGLTGPGTLEIETSMPVATAESLQPKRERIKVTQEKKEPKILESLQSLSLNYIKGDNHTKVTHPSSHYIPIDAGEHNITIETYGDTLIRATLYKQRLLNSKNSSHLIWRVPDVLSYLNQPKWKNSNIEAGLKRMEMILDKKETIADTIEQNHLIASALKSTTLDLLYPSNIPFGTIRDAYYGRYKLYQPKMVERLLSMPNSYDIPDLSHLKRGFFVDVPKSSAADTSKDKILLYKLKKRTYRDTQIELTITAETNSSVEFYVDSDNMSREKFSFFAHTPLESISLSKSIQAYQRLSKRSNPQEIISLIKDSSPIPLIEETATIQLTLPKGTKSISISRPDNSAPIKISARVRAGRIYQDSAYALGHNYADSYRRFINTLKFDAHVQERFDPWYEQTHALRLWMQSLIWGANRVVDRGVAIDSSKLLYAERIARDGDKFTAIQIAKHMLLLSKNSKLRDEAYRLLLELSSETTQALVWHVVYFRESGSPKTLEKIAQLLQENGRYSLALSARLLLDRGSSNSKKIANLSILLNKTQPGNYSHTPKGDPLNEKRKILSQKSNLHNHSSKDIEITASAGVVWIYSKNRDLYGYQHRAARERPVAVEIDGPRTIELSLRFLDKVSSFGWVKIEYKKEIYHYPLTNFKPSTSLSLEPGSQTVSIANALKLTFGEGKHRITIHGYSRDIGVSVDGYLPKESLYPKLSRQILKTSDGTPSIVIDGKPTVTIPYISALLWRDRYGDETECYRVRARAWMMSENSRRELKDEQRSILNILTRNSKFPLYSSLETVMGFYNIPVGVWHPSSTLQKNRTELLSDMDRYDRVLIGTNQHIIHLQAEQNITIEAEQISVEYLPTEPLSFAISIDHQAEEIIELKAGRLKWQREFELGDGEHHIKIRIVDPISTHYLGFRLLSNGNHLEQKYTQRFYLTSRDNPITIYEEGPKLLRIEERYVDENITTRYIYLPQKISYKQEIYPSKKAKESMVRISRMVLDPLSKPLREMDSSAIMPTTDSDRVDKEFSITYPQFDMGSYRPLPQSFDTTWSVAVSSRSVELSSDDDVESVAQNVIEAGIFGRKRVDDETFLRLHYFRRFYDNPLNAIRSKLYTKLPFENLWGTFEVNAYQQRSDYLFRNLHIEGEILKKEPLGDGWQHQYGGGLKKYFLDYDDPESPSLDPLVYSEYKKDHQHGGYLLYNLHYNPYDDFGYQFKMKASSNEQLNTVDYVGAGLKVKHLMYPMDLTLYYDGKYYFEDEDRPEDYSINRIGGAVNYNNFFDDERLSLQALASYKVESQDAQLSLQLIWHFSKNRTYYNFMPREQSFNSLHLLLDDTW